MHKRMILSMVALVTLMLVATAAVPILAADGPTSTMSGQKSAMSANDISGTAPRNVTDQRPDQNTTMRLFQALQDRNPLFGPLSKDDGNVSGRYISFAVNPANGTIQDYALNVSGNMTPIFTSVAAAGFEPTSMNVSGPLFTSTGDNLTMSAANSPLGTFHVTSSDNASINLSMPAGFTVAPFPSSNSSVKAWSVTGNGISALLVIKNGTTRTNPSPSTSSAGYVNVSLSPDGAVVFRAIPVAGGFPLADERFVISQLANWSIEGEMAIVTIGNNTFWFASEEGSLVPNVNVSQGAVLVNLTPMSNVVGAGGSLQNLLPGGQNTTRQNNETNPAPPVAQTGSNDTAQSAERKWYVVALDKNTVNPANGTVQVLVNGFQLSMANSAAELANNSSTFWSYQGTNASVFVIPLPTSNGSVSIVIQEGNQAGTSTTSTVSLAMVTLAGVAIVAVIAVIGAAAYARRKK